MGKGNSHLFSHQNVGGARNWSNEAFEHQFDRDVRTRQQFASRLARDFSDLVRGEGVSGSDLQSSYRSFTDYDPKKRTFTFFGRRNTYVFDRNMNLIGTQRA